jgi:hypothetical protein
MFSSPFWISAKILFSRWIKIFIVFSIVTYLTFFELQYFDYLQIFLFNIFLSINYMMWQWFCDWCRKTTVKLLKFKEKLETGIDKDAPDWNKKIEEFEKMEEIKK